MAIKVEKISVSSERIIDRRGAEGNTARLQRELCEFGKDATIGSAKLLAINDLWMVKCLDNNILIAELNMASDPKNKRHEIDLTVELDRRGRILDKMDEKKVSIPDHDKVLTRLIVITNELQTAYDKTITIGSGPKSLVVQQEIVANLDTLRSNGINRPTQSQPSQEESAQNPRYY